MGAIYRPLFTTGLFFCWWVQSLTLHNTSRRSVALETLPSTNVYKKNLKDISSRSFEFLHYFSHMLGLQVRMDGEKGFSAFIAAVSSTSNVQFKGGFVEVTWGWSKMPRHFSREFSKSFSIPYKKQLMELRVKENQWN